MTKRIYWERPSAKSVGLFTDLRLIYEALEIAKANEILNINILKNKLPDRVKGLRYIESFRQRTFMDLIRELTLYGFIMRGHTGDFQITPAGRKLIAIYDFEPTEYRSILISKMQKTYIIPGWFINRLWELNPIGQGQIIIPAPIKDWMPKSKKWEDYLFNLELKNICIQTLNEINLNLPGAFPVNKEDWLNEVKSEYERQGKLNPRKKEKRTVEFSQRRRLSLAMKNVAVKLLFGAKNLMTEKVDFYRYSTPLTHRAFMVWCPRLEALEMLFYSDNVRGIPGRLVFPTSVFKKPDKHDSFKEVQSIKNPNDENLYIYNPLWLKIRNIYLETLHEVYQKIYDRDGIIYVSLQEVRDEVCRLLRINAELFEKYLKKSFEESIQRKIDFSISLETDIRQDMKNQTLRRGVYIDNISHSLIAIKPYK